jgi:signal transduction histidine kinase
MTEYKHPQKIYVQKAQYSLKKLDNLIKDLLDVSKIQSGQLELIITEFNIDNLLDETIAAMQMVTSSHQIIRKDEASNRLIHADRQRIEQVLVNLLSNAIKYSPGEKEVFVYSKLTETELIVNVRDFGKGVPAEEQTHIFERFYRSKELSAHVSGFGLGLYICRDIINRHNGRIGVESDRKGSVFYFSLLLKNAVYNNKKI